MNNMEWLKNESGKWVEEGIITPEQGLQIQMRYPVIKTGSPLLFFFAIIGSILIGTGIILIFATNWYKLPIIIKIILAFIPLLVAQAVCMFTYVRKNDSASFKEGGGLFLSLSFFAAVALIMQIFHRQIDIAHYVLICILSVLPIIYLFRAKAALAVYIFGLLYVAWSLPVWVALIIAVLVLPFFYLEFLKAYNKGVLNYMLTLITLMVPNIVIVIMRDNAELLESATACGLVMLLVDALFRKIHSVYYFTPAKLLAILCISATLIITAFDFSYSSTISITGVMFVIIIFLAYAAVRYITLAKVASSDLIALSAVILVLSAGAAGAMANLLAMALGIFFIVRGSRAFTLNHLNYGMIMVISVIGIRFFDSSISLLGRGIVFIILGSAFLSVNIYISRKRKGR